MIDYNLKDKVVLITGANNIEGIGAATAFVFAEQGAKIAIVYKKVFEEYDESKTEVMGLDRYFKANSGDASQVEQKLKTITNDYIIIESDVSKLECIVDIYDKVIKQFGQIDILVNNAAMADENGKDTIKTITEEIIDSTLDVNVKGTLLMTAEFVKRKGSWGRIINLSTDASQAFVGQIIYGSSKANIEALTRSVAIELANENITVNCICPGPTQTGYISAEFEKEVIKDMPCGRLILPQEIAKAILFLASDESQMITGQVIKVSGGHSL